MKQAAELNLFTAALGLAAPWGVTEVRFAREEGKIEFEVEFAKGSRFVCPVCGEPHQGVHDTKERRWRHLNFFEYQAFIEASVPRVRCEKCGKTSQVEVPWARPQSGFTLLLEALLVTLAREMPAATVARLLGVGEMRIWRVLDHYVEGARSREDYAEVKDVGVDETAARRGQNYISVFHDAGRGCVLFVCPGRKQDVFDQFVQDLEAHRGHAANIRSVCMDMSASYIAGAAASLPDAAVSFDEFHVIKLVNEAVDEVRREEVKTEPCLRRTRYLWLKNTAKWSRKQIVKYAELASLGLKTERAYRIKERLRDIYASAQTAEEAEILLKKWYSWARRCRLEPMKRVAKTLKDHWQGLLNSFDSKLTNGRAEGINSLIQAAKAKARGYGTTRHLITMTYLIAGNLVHLPASPYRTTCSSRPTAC